jgi:hypothetical protein
MPDGHVPETARLLVGPELEPRAWRRDAPAVRLPVGRPTVDVHAGRFGEWRSGELEIDVPASGASVEVPLGPRRAIVGRVLFPPGETARDVSVSVARLGAPRSEDEFWFDRDEATVEVEDEGWFHFGADDGLPPDVYDVSAAPWKNGPARVTRRVTVAEEPVFVELSLPRTDLAEGVVLHALDARGDPIAADRLSVYVDVTDDRGSGGSGGAVFQALAGGPIWVPTVLTRFSGQEPVEVVLRVAAQGLGTRRVDVPSVRGSEPLTVRFETPATVRLSIDGRHGWLSGPLTARVVERFRNGWWGHGTPTPVPPGRAAELEAIQPGAYRLVVDGEHDGWRVSLDVGTLSVRPGSQRVTLRAPELYDARLEGVQGSPSLWRDGDVVANAQWKGPGEHAANGPTPGLPAGDYVARSSSGTARLRLPASGPAVFVADR